jgi:predicted DNA-binding transcriptional regulator AlpA
MVKIGFGSRWVESEVNDWLLARIAERDGKRAA